MFGDRRLGKKGQPAELWYELGEIEQIQPHGKLEGKNGKAQ